MVTLPDIITQLQFITYEMALLGLFITAGVILIIQDWRILILALLIQYILEGIILMRLVRPDIAVLKVLIGAFICPILFLSARQVMFNTVSLIVRPPDRRKWGRLLERWQEVSGILVARNSAQLDPTGFTFRLFMTLLVMLMTLVLSRTFPLLNLAQSIVTAIYWLGFIGLITLVVTEDPLKAGIGLLTTLTGFSLFYTAVEPGLLLTGLWGTVNLLIALAVGYLTVVKGTGPKEEEL